MRGALLAAVLFVSYAWFYQAGGWNQNSRFDLIRAVVERGTVRIDAYHQNTGDKARRGGHVYSDKAPGLALFAVPAAAAVRPRCGRAGSEGYASRLSYLVTLWASALPMVGAAMLLWWAVRRLGGGEGGALFAALAFGLATPAWSYATLLFGHALATFGVVAAWAAGIALTDDRGPRRDLLLSAALGLSAGWATITEYPAAVPAVLLALFALAQVWAGGWPRRLRVGAGIAAGGAIAATVLVSYNLAAFGAPLETGYTHVEGFGGMRQGFMGVTYPKLPALWGITFSTYRGLFFHAPVLLLAVLGWPLLLRARPSLRPMVIALVIALYYLLFNSAYFYWHGGWSHGPRHLAPALPFLCLPLAWLWMRATRLLRGGMLATAMASLVLTLAVVSTTAQPPEPMRRPLATLAWPAFVAGDLSLNHQSFLEAGADWRRLRGGGLAHDAWNLGEAMGLRGSPSLLPLLALWAAAAVLGWRFCRTRRGSGRGDGDRADQSSSA